MGFMRRNAAVIGVAAAVSVALWLVCSIVVFGYIADTDVQRQMGEWVSDMAEAVEEIVEGSGGHVVVSEQSGGEASLLLLVSSASAVDIEALLDRRAVGLGPEMSTWENGGRVLVHVGLRLNESQVAALEEADEGISNDGIARAVALSLLAALMLGTVAVAVVVVWDVNSPSLA